jgi:hypothetical protein
MISTMVFFTVNKNIPHVNPSFVAGKKDSLWVETRTADKEDIEKAVRRKAELCYGLNITDLEFCNQFGETEE